MASKGTSKKKVAFRRDTGATVPCCQNAISSAVPTGFTVLEAPDPEPNVHMNMLSAADQPDEGGDSCATDDTGDEGVAPTQPPTRLGCGAPVASFGHSFLTSSLVCTLFVVCAAAAPLTASGVGGASEHVCAALPVSGARRAAPAAAMPAALPPAGFRPGRVGPARRVVA
ncbi:hypothetical protein CYMTET_5680 [Cymbomonas tetramitiformis]|uniref:Uncharacterized protein n=1 Tax=Cymbomonas tetramitiformis TaxID=36881 RepID=A0AAE0GZ07_9CHLO|nr:hypothetical protein CYMTET_5680 [Cymbomonas tetramitiformis]